MMVALAGMTGFSVFVFMTTGAERGVMLAAIVGYGLAAIWYTVAALRAAARVLREGS